MVGLPPLPATTPTEASEALNADVVIHGDIRPEGAANALTLRFYLRQQYKACLLYTSRCV